MRKIRGHVQYWTTTCQPSLKEQKNNVTAMFLISNKYLLVFSLLVRSIIRGTVQSQRRATEGQTTIYSKCTRRQLREKAGLEPRVQQLELRGRDRDKSPVSPRGQVCLHPVPICYHWLPADTVSVRGHSETDREACQTPGQVRVSGRVQSEWCYCKYKHAFGVLQCQLVNLQLFQSGEFHCFCAYSHGYVMEKACTVGWFDSQFVLKGHLQCF